MGLLELCHYLLTISPQESQSLTDSDWKILESRVEMDSRQILRRSSHTMYLHGQGASTPGIPVHAKLITNIWQCGG